MTDETQQEGKQESGPERRAREADLAAGDDQVAEGAEAGAENDLDAAAELPGADVTDIQVDSVLSASDRIGERLKILTDTKSLSVNDVERIHRRLIDIVNALEVIDVVVDK